MGMRRILLLLIGVLSLCVLVGAGALGWLLLRPPTRDPIQLVVIDANATMRVTGANERVLRQDVQLSAHRFPAVSPNGDKIAFIAQEGDDQVLYRLQVASGASNELYRSSVNIPLDLAWSPDGKYVTFLLAGATGFSVHIVPDGSSQPSQVIASGSQSFFAWRPDSQALLMHLNGHIVSGGSVEVYTTGDKRTTQVVGDPGLFQAPAWSLDGKSIFYVAQPPITTDQPTVDDIVSTIVRADANGGNPTVLANEKLADVRMVRAPTSNQVAYTTLTPNADGSARWGPLKLIDDTGATSTLSAADEQVTSFFWSPDSSKVLYLSHQGTFNATSERTLHVVDLQTGDARTLARFVPSAALVDLQNFFDAYQFSFSPWSPDGVQITYSADDGVYVVDTKDGTIARVGDSGVGLWIGAH